MHPTEMQKSVSVQVDSDFALLLPSGAYEIKKMEPRSKLRKVILFCLLLSLFGMVAFGYFCTDQVKQPLHILFTLKPMYFVLTLIDKSFKIFSTYIHT